MPQEGDEVPYSKNYSSYSSPISWKDQRFPPAIDAVRKACGTADHDREDDAMIGMLLDRFSWNHDKVVEQYTRSVTRRKELGVSEIKAKIVDGGLGLEELPGAADVRAKMVINGSMSLDKATGGCTGDGSVNINGTSVAYGDVIGCYEMRYGHSDTGDSKSTTAEEAARAVTPAQFTKYMVWVTQWRWLQCENYIRRHGELGFWSMVHDISCPDGYMALYSRFRSLLGQYMPPVEEACAGLFPPMVQNILIINVPRIFGPAWSLISTFLPQHHKDRIVLLTTSYTSAQEVGKYVPQQHMPPHLKAGRPDGHD